MVVTPVIIQFSRIFHEISHPFLEFPNLWKPPYSDYRPHLGLMVGCFDALLHFLLSIPHKHDKHMMQIGAKQPTLRRKRLQWREPKTSLYIVPADHNRRYATVSAMGNCYDVFWLFLVVPLSQPSLLEMSQSDPPDRTAFPMVPRSATHVLSPLKLALTGRTSAALCTGWLCSKESV